MTCMDYIHNDLCEAMEMNGLSKVHPKQCGFYTDKSRYVELPCKVGDLVRFKGLENPWKVSAIHLCAEGQPQISLTSGKITTTMTFSEFSEDAFVLSQEEAEKALAERSGHMTEKTCKDCIHFGACSKWTDFPKQCGVPVCASFAQQSEGEWIPTDFKDEVYEEYYECSACKIWNFKSAYCPNCGARMKGGAE